MSERLARPRASGLAWLFPGALWFVAAFFLLGDLGKWNDDWFFLLREPETGEIRSLYLDKGVHFWRPLYRAVAPGLQTLLWRNDPLNHLISAGAHGVNALLLWLLLRRLGARRLAAAMAGLLFLTLPAPYEAVFWLCALPTSLSTMLMLVSMLLCVGLARGRVPRAGVLLFPALAFAAASLNEQPACLAAALPFVYLAARPEREHWRRSILKSMAPAAGAGLALALYVVLHERFTTFPTAVGHGGLMIPPGRMPAQVPRIAGWLRMQVLSADFATRAAERGLGALAAHPVRTAVVGMALLSGGAAWVWHQGRFGHERAALPAGVRPGSPVLLALLGAAAFLAPWAPIVVFNYWLNSRIAYAPMVGGCILAAALAMSVAPRDGAGARAGPRFAVAGVLAAVVLFHALVMVGIQRGYQLRARQDLREVARLHALVPNPPRGAVFVPALLSAPAKEPRHERFDNYFWGSFCSWWAGRWVLRHEYKRSDLDAGSIYWGRAGMSDPTATDVLVHDLGRVPWERVIPFEIDADGEVRIITRVEAETTRGRLVVEVPATATLAVPRRVFAIPP